jgi:PqqA peptide cyclase
MQYRPLSLLAELTYRCNLQCPYCYNPLDLQASSDELDVRAWCRVIEEAAALGILQVHLSGGEPTLRADDCCSIVQRARQCGMYSNLITGGTFLSDTLLDRLLAAGLDHIQISVQAAQAERADRLAGATVHEKKLDAIRRSLQRPVAVTLNCVLHRFNIDEIEKIIALAEELGVKRLELAHAQFYGWAFRNRAALLPMRDQVERARSLIRAARVRLAGHMEIAHVLADYYEEFPKPCMGGWGQQYLTVAPDGRVLPCPAATSISTLDFENVRNGPLARIWSESEAFRAFRGVDWMPEPCRSCDRRDVDFGGCRCQAFLLTGDPGATDPACVKSPKHFLIERATREPQASFVPRRM